MYPGIGQWYSDKVLPGLKTSERIGYVAFEDERPIASAVLKKGERAKFCHLRIHEDFRDLDLGQMFFTQMTLEARHIAKEIHFTLPELAFGDEEVVAFFVEDQDVRLAPAIEDLPFGGIVGISGIEPW